MGKRIAKDPDDVLDYKFDFAALTNGSGSSDWLESGETISSFTVTPETGITVDSSARSDANTSVTVWLSDGEAGSEYGITCHIVTSASREVDRTLTIVCFER